MNLTSIAGIAILDEKILIALRNPTGQMGNRWEFPGGKVENGETDEEAVIREFKEEFGIVVTVKEQVAAAVFSHNGEKINLHAYKIEVPHDGMLIPYELSEHSAYRWAYCSEIENLSFVDSDLLIFPQVKKLIESENEK